MAITQETRIGEIKEWLGDGSVNIFGLPFAGKDIQGDRLAAGLGATKISSGDLLRDAALTEEERAFMNAGGILPTEKFVEVVTPKLASPDLVGPLVLSSVGRALGEEQGVMQAAREAGHPIMVVPFLEISPEVAFERLAAADRGRDDDTPDALMVRFDEFQNQTQSVIDVYHRLGLVVSIEAFADEASVFDATVRAIHEFAQAN
jgi:adenylate kinase